MDNGYRTISVKKKSYDKANEVHKKLGIEKSFSAWISEYVLMNLEKDDFLHAYAPYISKIGIIDNVLTLKDSKKNCYVEVRMVNGKLQSDDGDPIYIQYAMALPELGQLK